MNETDTKKLEDIHDDLIIARGLVHTVSELLTPITDLEEPGTDAMFDVYRRRHMLDASTIAISDYLKRALEVTDGGQKSVT